jgi:hypothetical protein
MSDTLAALIGGRFIQRRNFKAVQFSNGSWSPDRELKHLGDMAPLGFKLPHIEQHLAGTHTYGHYLIDDEDMCRVFAFDLDLETSGYYCLLDGEPWEPIECNPRVEWLNRASPARPWLKTQMSVLARKLISAIQEHLGTPCAAAYSGSKGIHVYGFTKEMEPNPAELVRDGAKFVLDATGDWELFRGTSFYKHKLQDPALGYPNFTLEIYPRQSTLEGKDLGNLLRLPLGRNLKSTDPCFFLDLNTPVGALVPHSNPVALLSSGNPFA